MPADRARRAGAGAWRPCGLALAGTGLALLRAGSAWAASGVAPTGVWLDGARGGAAQLLRTSRGLGAPRAPLGASSAVWGAPKTASATQPAGTLFEFPQSVGVLSGGNLFFSFQYFNLAAGQTALFSTTSAGIENLISRVVGGSASTIDGNIILQAAYGKPNFFFINPAGVTFTANARVSVPAGFYVSTADYLKFNDGNFYADPSKQSKLSAAAPEAFGFLGLTRAPVNLQGAELSAGTFGDADLQLVAGDVTIGAAGTGGAAGVGGTIVSTTGGMRLIAVGAQAAEVPLAGSFNAGAGAVTLQDGGALISLGSATTAAGSIYVSGGTVEVNAAGSPNATGLFTRSSGAGSGAITVGATGAVLLTDGGEFNSTATSGTTGDVTLNAGSLTIDRGTSNTFTGISASTFSGSTGNGGRVTIATSGATNLLNGGAILSGTGGAGNAGAVTLTAGSLSIEGGSADVSSSISTSAVSTASGSAGPVSVTVAGAITLAQGGQITSGSSGPGNAGSLSVKAASLSIDGGNTNLFTGISSAALSASSGNAGDVSVTTSGATTVSNGASIVSTTAGSGSAGNLAINAGSLAVSGGPLGEFTEVSSSALFGSTGNAGQVSVTTSGATSLFNGAQILSATFAAGKAGAVTVNAGSLSIDGGTSNSFTEISSAAEAGSSGNAGVVSVTAAGATVLSNGGLILSNTLGTGNAGLVSVATGSLDIESGGGIASNAVGADGIGGSAGTVALTVGGTATLSSGGSITSKTETAGNAGDVTLAAGSLSIVGGAEGFTGINSSAEFGSRGNAGQVSVTTTGATTISTGGQVLSATFGAGNAGRVSVNAESLEIDGGTFNGFTGISSSANGGSSGNGGQVSVTTAGATTLSSGGEIQSVTFASGDAGELTVNAASLNINGGTSPAFTGITSSAEPGSSGNAGRVSVTTAGATTISQFGEILSGTFSTGNAGDITLQAESLNVDATGAVGFLTGVSSSAQPGSRGNAGKVTVNTTGSTTLSNGGDINSDTDAVGNAGAVTLTAGSLTIDGGIAPGFTGISSAAIQGSSGAAGVVTVDVSGTAALRNYGGIASSAEKGSGGQPGTIAVTAGTLLLDSNGGISIANHATAANPASILPTQIDIDAGTLQMNGGQISAASTGNIGASAIKIDYGQSLHMDPSTISTSANDGDGGPITITGQGPLFIDHSNITTSVSGASGNGGDIQIAVPVIVMDTAAIQANTAARLAAGGNVSVDAQALVPSFQSFILGGNTVAFDATAAGLNVVQAVAPDGVSGVLSVTNPTLDIGNSLLGLTGHPAAPTPLGRGKCGYTRGSSLSVAGRGGLPASGRDPLWMDVDGVAEDRAADEPAAGAPARGPLSAYTDSQTCRKRGS